MLRIADPASTSAVLSLLRYAACGHPPAWASFQPCDIQRAIETGLGPLLFAAAQNASHASSIANWSLVHSVACTEQMLTADRIDALCTVIHASASRLRTPITLLKGISISEQHYPSAYLRPMRDLDILVAPEEIDALATVLQTLGYEPDSAQPLTYYRHHHHIAPFHHPTLDLWIEVHHALFPPHHRSGQDPLFARAHVATQLQRTEFHGQTVQRLSNELQLLYTITHWTDHCEPEVGVLALLDVMYLINNTTTTLDWERIVTWLASSSCAPAVYLVLSYLAARELIDLPPHILDRIATAQQSLGPHGLSLLHLFIDRYFVCGKPFRWWWSARNVEIVWRTLLRAKPSWHNTLQAPWNLLFGRAHIFYDLS